jgi:hypothetical protein
MKLPLPAASSLRRDLFSPETLATLRKSGIEKWWIAIGHHDQGRRRASSEERLPNSGAIAVVEGQPSSIAR